MTRHSFRSCLNGLLIVLLLAGCGGRAPTPTVVPVTPAVSPTQIAEATATPTGAATPTATAPGLEPTQTAAATATSEPANNAPANERPVIDNENDHVKQVQILAQWSTGTDEASYGWSADGARLLLVSAPVVRMIDVMTFQQIWEAPGGENGQFSEDGSQVAIKKGAVTRVLRAADGQPDQSGTAFQAALTLEMSKPSKDKPTAKDFIEVQEDGTHRQLRFNDENKYCADAVYTDLPAGITGYTLSPDGRLLLLVARGLDAQPDYQAVVLGINSGFESPLPAHLTGAEQPGFHPTRPSLAAPFMPVLVSPLFGQSEFPPALAAPDGPAQAYQFAPLDESSGLVMIKALVEFGVANDIRGPANGPGNLYNAQEALHTGLLEYLARFPPSPNRTAVEWMLALNNTVLNSHTSDDWIANQLEGALNRKDLAPSLHSLNAGLAPFGFFVDATYKSPSNDYWAVCDSAQAPPWPLVVNNLLGDGRSSLVFTLRTVWTRVGTLFTLHQDAGGSYHIFPVGGQWDMYAGERQDVQIIDLLGDGQPVIRLDYYWHNGSMNGRDTFFYRWQGSVTNGGKFIELTGGIDAGINGSYLDLQFQGGPGTAKTIVAPRISDFNTFGQSQTLTWNGQHYVSSIHIPLTNDSGDILDWLVAAVANHQYAEVVHLIKTLPGDLSWRQFFLGYVEALQFHPGQARLAFQPLADKASQEPANTIAQAAQAFLAAYHLDTDLVYACQAALKVSKDAYCNTVFATRSYLEWLSQQPPGDLPAVLAGYGIQFSAQVSLDANGDGRQDWVLAQKPLARSQDNVTRNPIWLILSNGAGFQFFDLYLKSPLTPGYPSGNADYDGGTLVCAPILLAAPNQKSVQILMIEEGQTGLFLRLRQDGGASAVDSLMLDEYVSSYQVVFQKDGSSQLVLFHDLDGFSPSIFRWNPASETLDESDYLEHLLLIENNPAEALRLIPGMLNFLMAHPGNEDWKKLRYTPRLQFLLGMAYELSGDTENAFRTDYALWKAFPMDTNPGTLPWNGHEDQPYVIMAQARLVKK